MKVLHISKYDQKGGAAIAALNSVRAQRQIGIDAVMAVGRKFGQEPFVHGPNMMGDAMAIARFGLERIPGWIAGAEGSDTRSIGISGVNVEVLLAKHRPEIVVLHNIDGLLRIEDLPKIRVPVIWRLHDMWAFGGTQHYSGTSWARPPRRFASFTERLDAWTKTRKLEALTAIKSVALSPPSQWLGREARAIVPVLKDHIRVIPNGIDIDLLRPMPMHDARVRLNLPDDAFLILFGSASGMSDPRKGFDLLENALSNLSSRVSRRRTVIVTFGGNFGKARIGSFPGIQLGKIVDRALLPFVYAAADVTVVPSREENLSLTVLESMACGTPVVAFNIGGMPDMIDSGVNGSLANPFDTIELARCIDSIAGLGGNTEALRSAARQKVVGSFDRINEARQMQSLFEELLR